MSNKQNDIITDAQADMAEVHEYNGYTIEIYDTQEGCFYNILKDSLLLYGGGSKNPNDCLFNAQYRIDNNYLFNKAGASHA